MGTPSPVLFTVHTSWTSEIPELRVTKIIKTVDSSENTYDLSDLPPRSVRAHSRRLLLLFLRRHGILDDIQRHVTKDDVSNLCREIRRKPKPAETTWKELFRHENDILLTPSENSYWMDGVDVKITFSHNRILIDEKTLSAYALLAIHSDDLIGCQTFRTSLKYIHTLEDCKSNGKSAVIANRILEFEEFRHSDTPPQKDFDISLIYRTENINHLLDNKVIYRETIEKDEDSPDLFNNVIDQLRANNPPYLPTLSVDGKKATFKGIDDETNWLRLKFSCSESDASILIRRYRITWSFPIPKATTAVPLIISQPTVKADLMLQWKDSIQLVSVKYFIGAPLYSNNGRRESILQGDPSLEGRWIKFSRSRGFDKVLPPGIGAIVFWKTLLSETN